MKEIGIMFSAPMVRAVDQDRKTQTRRLASSPLARLKSGTRLWVRETFRFDVSYDGVKPVEIAPMANVLYAADGTSRCRTPEQFEPGKLRPAIHMPRFAARLGLVLESVRVEPLQAISEDDAVAEGLRLHYPPANLGMPHYVIDGLDLPRQVSARMTYAALWQSLHRKEGERWEDNPDVVVLTFAKAWVDK